MRKLLPWLTPLLLLSGCVSDDGGTDTGSDGPEGSNPMTNATLEPLHWEGDVTVGADPFNFLPVGGGVCSQDVSTCFFHDFVIPGNQSVNLEATLAWGTAGNDFDLYLYQGSTQVSQDGINSIDPTNPASLTPQTTQVMHHTATAGAYTFWVVVWNAVADSYTLDVTFTPA